MRRYGYADRLLLSEVPLPELAREPVPDGPPRFVCRRGTVGPPAGFRRRAQRDADGEVTRHVFSVPGGGWIVEFAAGPTFQLDGDTVTWSAPPAFPPDLLRHLLLDHALPLALSAGSDLVLHASCVAWHGVAAAFSGTTGIGKSSIAAACHARGARAISDDCILVGQHAAGWTARTIYSGLRLWPDAANRYLPDGPRLPMTADSVKLRVDVPPHRHGPQPLGRLYLLRRDAVAAIPRVEPARAADAMDILRNEFRLDLDDRDTLARHFDAVVALVREDLVRVLVIPDSLDAVAAAVALVSADLAATAVEDCA